MSGWIKLHRAIRDSWIYDEQPYSKFQAWIDLLLSANHKDNKFLLGNELVEVERGSFITSEHKLMAKWGWSKTKVRNFLSLLENDNMILKISDRKKTTITIVKYNDYQDLETTKEPPKDHEKTTKEPLKDPNKNDKNDKKDKNDKNDNNIILHEWNSLGLGQIKSISSNRLKLVQARKKEFSLDEIVQAIKSINNSNFLKGQNDRGWMVTFDWFIKPNNFVKVLEGNYIDKGGSNGKAGGQSKRENDEYAGIGFSYEDLQNLQ